MSFFDRLHDYLDMSSKPEPCDAIFVLAGRQERKIHGIDLWRVGYAPELILSVGRFEWRRFCELVLPHDGGLQRLVDTIPPVERHFFIREWKDRAESIAVKKGKYGTLTEALAVAVLLRDGECRSLMVVSSAIHLRRVALAFRRAFRGSGTRLIFVAVPNEPPETPSELLTELRKRGIHLTQVPTTGGWANRCQPPHTGGIVEILAPSGYPISENTSSTGCS